MDNKKRNKWTLETVQAYFRSFGFELQTNEYKKVTTKMIYKCTHCGNVLETSLNGFRQTTKKCQNCEYIAFKKEVRKDFSDTGCVLLSEYISAHEPVDYKCKCGNVAKILYYSFKTGVRCKQCSPDRQKAANIEKYGVPFYMQTKDFKLKTQKTIQQKYGVEYASQSPDFKAKAKVTNMEKYGVECVSQSSSVKDKIKATNQNKYGVANVSQVVAFREKSKQTMLEKYGVEHYTQAKDFEEKCKQTNNKKYGVDYPAQLPSIRARTIKSSFKLKEWASPSGKIFKYQGYELLAIEMLLKSGIAENDIITEIDMCETETMPLFNYEFEGKQRRYFPDLYIKSQNKFIEVKSDYTFNICPEKVMEKANSVYFANYNIEIWVFNGKEKLIDIITP